MALIRCPGCKNDISERLQTCPRCGRKLLVRVDETPSSDAGEPAAARTVELTSKALKKRYLIAMAMMVAGLACLGLEAGSGEPGFLSMLAAPLMLLGFGYMIVVRFRIWWHHR